MESFDPVTASLMILRHHGQQYIFLRSTPPWSAGGRHLN